MKKVGAFLLAAAMCFSLPACSASDSGTQAESTTSAVSEASSEEVTEESGASAESAQAADADYQYEVGPAIQEILDRGKLVVGIDSGYVPYCYTDPTTGESYGVNVTVAKRVAEILGVDCEVISETFSAVLSDLAVDNIDLVGAMVVNTEERAEIMDFTTSLRQGYDYLLVRSEDADKYTTKESLAGATVVANNGSVQYTHAEELQGINLIATESTADAALQVVTGTADAMVTSDMNGLMYEEGYAGQLVMTKDVNWEDDTASLAVNKGDDDLLALVNMVIEKEIRPNVDEMIQEEITRGVEILGVGK